MLQGENPWRVRSPHRRPKGPARKRQRDSGKSFSLDSSIRYLRIYVDCVYFRR